MKTEICQCYNVGSIHKEKLQHKGMVIRQSVMDITGDSSIPGDIACDGPSGMILNCM
jgi:hypothetical protein